MQEDGRPLGTGHDADGTEVLVGGDFVQGQIDFELGVIKLVEVSGEIGILKGAVNWEVPPENHFKKMS